MYGKNALRTKLKQDDDAHKDQNFSHRSGCHKLKCGLTDSDKSSSEYRTDDASCTTHNNRHERVHDVVRSECRSDCSDPGQCTTGKSRKSRTDRKCGSIDPACVDSKTRSHISILHNCTNVSSLAGLEHQRVDTEETDNRNQENEKTFVRKGEHTRNL